MKTRKKVKVRENIHTININDGNMSLTVKKTSIVIFNYGEKIQICWDYGKNCIEYTSYKDIYPNSKTASEAYNKLVRMIIPKHKFVNAQRMHKKHPKSFLVPSSKELNGLNVGDIVKVCAYRERFWVKITQIDGDKLQGRVDNILITNKLSYNDIIAFEKKNIYTIF